MKFLLPFAFVLASWLSLQSVTSAQTAAIDGRVGANALNFDLAELFILDPVAKSVTTLKFPVIQRTRGHTFGPDGALYTSWWISNAIGRISPPTPAGTWTTVAPDSSNSIIGAAYQPVVNNEADGGPGLWVIDGNTVGPNNRNTALISDLAGAGKSTLDIRFSDTFTPMADSYPDPLHPGEFLCVGSFSTNRFVWRIPLAGTPGTILVQGAGITVVTSLLVQPCEYDALIHDDGQLYCWSSNTSFVGFIKVDPATGTQTSVAVSGIKHGGLGYAAVWNEPWEKAGRIAYIAYDGVTPKMLYRVDLAQNPTTAVAIGRIPTAGSYRNGREVEESQLTAWWVKESTGRERNLHVNFGAAAAGLSYVVVPSRLGRASSPLMIDGLELWLQLDSVSLAWLAGQLSTSPGGVLDKTGQADKRVPELTGGLTTFWMAVAYDAKTGVLADASNMITIFM